MKNISLTGPCILAIALTLLSCEQRPKGVSIPVEHIVATQLQKDRRQRSETYCTFHNIPIYTNQTALVAPEDDSISIRSQQEVIDRTIALCYVGLMGEGVAKENLDKFNADFDVMPKLSSQERIFATAAKPTDQQMSNAGWRYEGLHVMLWALGFIDSLEYPDKQCDVSADVLHFKGITAEQFAKKAKLRSKKEILDQADLILRIHWACEEARVNNQKAPADLNSDVVMERHYVLNWLIKYSDQEWDDVTTDT